MNIDKTSINFLINESPNKQNIEEEKKELKYYNFKNSEILYLFQKYKYLSGKVIKHLSIKEQVNFLKSSWVANKLFKKLNGVHAPLTLEQTKELFSNVSFNECFFDRSHWYNRVVDIEPLFIKYHKNWTTNKNIPEILKNFNYLKSCQFRNFKLGDRGGEALAVFFQHIPQHVFTEKNIDLVFEKDDFFNFSHKKWSKFFNLFPNAKKIHFIENFEKKRQELNLLKQWNLISDDFFHLCSDFTLDGTLPVKENDLTDKTIKKRKREKKIHSLASLKLNTENSIKKTIVSHQNSTTKESSKFLSLLERYQPQELVTVIPNRKIDLLNGCEIAAYFEFLDKNDRSLSEAQKFTCISEIERVGKMNTKPFLPSWNALQNPELLTYSAITGFPPALYLSSVLKLHKSSALLFDDLDMKKAAEKGYAPAQTILGYLTFMKYLKTKAPSDSLSMHGFIQAAAAQKNSLGLYLEAVFHLYGYGIERDIALGLHLLSKAAFDFNYKEAIIEYAILELIGYLLPENKHNAKKLLGRFDQETTKRIMVRMFNYFNEQKMKGDAEAFYQLSQFYLDGWGRFPIDRPKWRGNLLYAIKLNHPKAIYQYGSCLCLGLGVEQNIDKGKELLRSLPNGDEIIQSLNQRLEKK